MSKRKTLVEGENGWSEWIAPVMDGFDMECCDCGLVHTIEFAVLYVTSQDGNIWTYTELNSQQYRVMFRAKRNKRSTGQARRHKREG